MARWDREEHLFSDDVYTVSKDDGTQTRHFTDKDEADAYYEYLKREEVQDSIARNQAAAVAQNQEIIANQQRLIEAQKNNDRLHQRPSIPQPTRQILDPAYKEWLEFQRETNPAFLKWKREKKEKEEREKRLQEEARQKREAENAERERRIAEINEQRMQQVRQQRLEEIAPIEARILNGEEVPVKDRNYVAQFTENQAVIDILKEINNERLLSYLKDNKFLNEDDLAYVKSKRNGIIKKGFEQSKMHKEMRESQQREKVVKSGNSGCAASILILLIPSIIFSILIFL